LSDRGSQLDTSLLPARLERFTPHTIVSRTELLAELGEIRSTGVALDLEEHTEGICAVGAAILDREEAVAAISVPVLGPALPRQGGRAGERSQGSRRGGPSPI